MCNMVGMVGHPLAYLSLWVMLASTFPDFLSRIPLPHHPARLRVSYHAIFPKPLCHILVERTEFF